MALVLVINSINTGNIVVLSQLSTLLRKEIHLDGKAQSD